MTDVLKRERHPTDTGPDQACNKRLKSLLKDDTILDKTKTIVPGIHYGGLPGEDWTSKTRELVTSHPLTDADLLAYVTHAWELLWTTQIGGSFPISKFQLNASAIGGMFEKLLAHTMAEKTGGAFRSQESKDEKDIVCVADPRYSIEVKTGTQDSLRVYGSRSYVNGSADSTKSRDSYYLTVNYDIERHSINLIRFGHLSSCDWIAQKSESGQQARIRGIAYQHKLRVIKGEYQRQTLGKCLAGIGLKSHAANKTVAELLQEGEGKGKHVKAAQTFIESEFYGGPKSVGTGKH